MELLNQIQVFTLTYISKSQITCCIPDSSEQCASALRVFKFPGLSFICKAFVIRCLSLVCCQCLLALSPNYILFHQPNVFMVSPSETLETNKAQGQLASDEVMK